MREALIHRLFEFQQNEFAKSTKENCEINESITETTPQPTDRNYPDIKGATLEGYKADVSPFSVLENGYSVLENQTTQNRKAIPETTYRDHVAENTDIKGASPLETRRE
ncbi:hypothetical protein [Acididesulfobacillus acetoxydans]|uniref:hypothetical protein n=1 Tax=Acididesulfobacillus acetoxydans TaxID=1561005 RepID=UPI001F119075|nr:hypothetical protein [Acididesulfobacillus acetoxydans]